VTPSPTQTATASATPSPTPLLSWVPLDILGQLPPDLRGLHFISPTAGWTVGTNGTILFYNGTEWVSQSSPSSNTLNSVSMLSRSAGWAVSDHGEVLRCRNGVWSIYTGNALPNDIYTDVSVRGTDQGSIIGRDSTFLYLQDGDWNVDGSTPDNTLDLSAVSFAPNGIGWAVSEHGDLVRFAGSWDPRPKVPMALYGVHMLTDTYGWATGQGGMLGYFFDSQCGATEQACWHFDTSRSYAGFTLRSVYMLSTTDGWAVGDGGAILHWNGQTWTTIVEPSILNPTLRRIIMVNPWEGWAIGDHGTILHYGGPQFAPAPTSTPSRTPNVTNTATATPSPTSTPSLTIIGTATPTVTPTSLTTVTQSPTPTSTVQGEWSAQVAGAAKLRALSFLDNGKGWAVGDEGAIWYYTGSQWTDQSGATSSNLNSVAMISSTSGWAVGDDGVVLRYRNGGWSLYQDTFVPPTENYLVVRTISSSNGWIFGANGTLLRLVDGQWQRDYSIPDGAINVRYAVLSADGQSGWAVGDNGLLLEYSNGGWDKLGQIVFEDHYGVSVIPDVSEPLAPWYGWTVGEYNTGGSSGMLYFPSDNCGLRTAPCWHTYDFPPQGALYDVALLADQDGWAVGEGGLIAHWDGMAWTSVASPTTNTLRALQFLSPANGWAVGDEGTVLHYRPKSSTSGEIALLRPPELCTWGPFCWLKQILPFGP
jgi:photosystem II stability/assembly factor-like uncharacterized protein